MTYGSLAARGGTIIVKIGFEQEEHILHKSLLVHHSGFFRGVLSEKFKETEQGFIELSEVHSTPFSIFIDWLYTGDLPSFFELSDRHTPYGFVECEAYVLADMLLAPRFKHDLLKCIFEKHEKDIPSYITVIYAFGQLPENDELLLLLVDAQCINGGVTREEEEEDKDYISELPHDFLVRVMKKLNQLDHMGKKPKKLQQNWYSLDPPRNKK